jgi:hypothetical protein
VTDANADLQPTTRENFPLSVVLWIGIKSWLRRDGVVVILYLVTTLVMSYPLAFKLGEPWLALRDPDTYVKLWDNWWLQNLAFKGPSLAFTDIQFHPVGLDLSFHSISWTVAIMSWALTLMTDAITAYNLTILIAIFSSAFAAYLLALRFVRYRAAAWLAGAVFSFAPYHIAHSSAHPDLVHLAPIPLAVLLMFTAIARPSVLASLGAALMIGLAGFTSLYIMVFALLTLGPVLVFLLLDQRRWAQANILRVVLMFGLLSVLLLSLRLVPIFRDISALTDAIDMKYTATENQTDLLSFVLPSQLNPFFAPFTEEIASRIGPMSEKWPAYLGVVPLALTISALTWKKKQKIAILWFSIGLFFVFLALGPTLLLNGIVYEDIVLPARFLSWFPPVRSVGRPDLFVMGILLPIAILAALGIDRLLIGLERNRTIQIALMIALPGLLLVEYWSGEFPGGPSAVSPFYEQLADEPGDFAIIQLPMGRSASKRYLYLQTIHQKAIVEGLSARTPVEAYRYINKNSLLQSWLSEEPLDCGATNQHRIEATVEHLNAVDRLIADDFRYVVVHHKNSEIPSLYADYFPFDPVYEDSSLTAYMLTDLLHNPPCQGVYERVMDLPSPETSTSITWDQKIGLLGYDLPANDPDSEILSIGVYWQSQIEMEDSLISFFHVIDSKTGVLVAQADVIPRGWSYPTNWWLKGEVVEDTVQISMKNVPSGHYELHIGWYDEETGMRLLPESDQIQLFSDGSALLTVIEN